MSQPQVRTGVSGAHSAGEMEVPVTSLLEKAIEDTVGREVLQLSKELNMPIHYLKLTIAGNRGWPDRLLLWPNRGVMFIEFKRPGQKPRKLQEFVHAAIRRLGFVVEVHDNVGRAMAAIEAQVVAQTRTGAWDGADPKGEGGAAVPPSWKGQDQRGAEKLPSTKVCGICGQASCSGPSSGCNY